MVLYDVISYCVCRGRSWWLQEHSHISIDPDIHRQRRHVGNGSHMKTIHQRLPRYLRRLIHDTSQCHYQREEYQSAVDRNDRYRQLRGAEGLIRYSDVNAIGLLVYVVAWTRPTQSPLQLQSQSDSTVDGMGMAGANRDTTGGRVPYSPKSNLSKIAIDDVSMETKLSPLGKLLKIDIANVSMENVIE